MACLLPLIDKNTREDARTQPHTHSHIRTSSTVLTEPSDSQSVASHRGSYQLWISHNNRWRCRKRTFLFQACTGSRQQRRNTVGENKYIFKGALCSFREEEKDLHRLSNTLNKQTDLKGQLNFTLLTLFIFGGPCHLLALNSDLGNWLSPEDS